MAFSRCDYSRSPRETLKALRGPSNKTKLKWSRREVFVLPTFLSCSFMAIDSTAQRYKLFELDFKRFLA